MHDPDPDDEGATVVAPDPPFDGFPAELFAFLRELESHNDRAWMDDHRVRYEEHVRAPALAFVRAVAPRLASVCPRLVASDRRVGGSLLRVNRDTRFTASKKPYHTTVVIRFPHADTEPRWAPGCGVRLTSRAVYLTAGLRVPGTHTLQAVRETIDAYPEEWADVRRARGFRAAFGDLDPPDLVRVPPGWPQDHPFAADLRRKHFVATCELAPDDVGTRAFATTAVRAWRSASPLLRFLCDAVGLAWEGEA
jgi:uncharacterized protein (TIGR02453 family)